MKNIYNVITDCCEAALLDESRLNIHFERYQEFLNSAGVVTVLTVHSKTDESRYLRIKWVDIEHEESSVPFVEWNTLLTHIRLPLFMEVLTDRVGSISY
jgi:hypothetical protein